MKADVWKCCVRKFNYQFDLFGHFWEEASTLTSLLPEEESAKTQKLVQKRIKGERKKY
jgi:hypothetical protein